MIRKVALCLGLLGLSSCHRVEETPKPKLEFAIQDRYLKQLPSSFSPLSPLERQEDWGKEFRIASGFAKELDLYSAVTAYKRAEFLLPSEASFRKTEIDYDVFFSYYLGKRYEEAIFAFEKSDLRRVDPSFPAYQDLLICLYDSYSHLGKERESGQILSLIQAQFPAVGERLFLSEKLLQGDISAIEKIPNKPDDVSLLLSQYAKAKKSVGAAAFWNAVLPGAGYLYLGQTQSAFTALFLNGFFIWAATAFFQNGYIAAGIITTSFEAGWYFGGIYGAVLNARFHNDRVYESLASPVMQKERLFPILQLKYAF